MKLFEILVGDSKKGESTQHWVAFKSPKISFYPRYSDNISADIRASTKDDKLAREIRYEKLNYSDPNSHGWFSIDDDKKLINFDITKFTDTDTRRPASKMDNYNHRAKEAYPLFGGATSFNRIIVMIKVLKAVVKHDPKTASYKIEGDERVNGKLVSDIISGKANLEKYDHAKLFDTKTESVTLFHGTSEKLSKLILKSGLKNSQREISYGDMIDGYSEKNVYLAFNPAEAANYATRQAIDNNSKAVILEVTLYRKQFEKLLADEDSMHWFEHLPSGYKKRFLKNNPIIDEIWDGEFTTHIKHLKHDEKKFGLKWLRTQSGLNKEFKERAIYVFKKYGLDTEVKIEEVETQTFMSLVKTFVDGTTNLSLKKTGVVAYPGSIPASQVKVLKTWEIKGTKISKDDYSKKEYHDAIDKQQSTVKR